MEPQVFTFISRPLGLLTMRVSPRVMSHPRSHKKTFWEEVYVVPRVCPWDVHRWNPLFRGLSVALAFAISQLQAVLKVSRWLISDMPEPDIGPAVKSHPIPRESRG